MRNSKYLQALTNTQSIEELWDMHTRKMASYGFDRLLYGFTRYRTSTSLGDPDDFIVLTNHDPAYTDVFMGKGLYFHGPMVKWVLENEGAASWSILGEMLDQGALSDSEKRVLEFNRKMQVTAGYSISFKSISPRAKGAIALTAQADIPQEEIDKVWAEHGDEILVMNNVCHLKIMTLPYATPNQTLTKRQREALEWVGDGKTTQDIALLMGLTPATVEKHLRLARDNLNVETTAQAVLKAALQNQMFVIEA
ncbi:MAG: LuxR family transcriptional regulator [Pseudomonadota bacterium]|jgi:LuxR family transcriptional regulator|uniref:LuxR family transcriptional regulator n=1 Tax=Thalassovita sp. TaxID=1979401 RepID=UPI002AB3180F|nr:LuxR family transcriptional regulator [Thalassovita sp.]MEC7965555.1 LuxR family transcriptional regulator [Pseudomonadota bacterium]MEC8041201.1 LuxR family transcriptional regulator [Pseudomonadota bacterium]MEC8295682.1 LuxR family transcriptional regulator [Pseudomonadota bacterium]